MSKKFVSHQTDIVETVLKRLKNIWAQSKSLRLVHYQRISNKTVGLEGINRAFDIKLAGGQRLKLAVLDSWNQHDDLLRQCKARDEFIPLLVDTGHEKEETLIEMLLALFRSAAKFIKRHIRKHRHVRPGRSTDNYIQQNHAPCMAH